MAVSCIAGAMAAPVEEQKTASESKKDLETAEGHLGVYGGGLGYGGGYGGHGYGAGYGTGYGGHGYGHGGEYNLKSIS